MDHNQPEDFLIIRLSSLGDIIHTLPAFAALRRKFPNSRITWLVEGKGKEILDLVPGIDRIIVNRLKDFPLLSKHFRRAFQTLRREIHDKEQTALDFQGLLKSGLFAALSGAQNRWGFPRKNLKEPSASVFYTRTPEPQPEQTHVIQKNLHLLTLADIHSNRFDFPLRIPSSVKENVNTKLTASGVSVREKLMICNVGAAWETKRWHSAKWIPCIYQLQHTENDLRILLLWGNESEKRLAEEISAQTGVSLVPFLNLQETFALLERADLLLSGDTFALQAACALGTPTVGLFGPTTPERNGPFSEADKIAIHSMDCSHCYRRTCTRLECMNGISSEEVAHLCHERRHHHA